MRRVYLDNNATTPVLPEVLEAMRPYFAESFGNASSIHHFGQQARAAVERARQSVADLVGARPAEIVFTSGGTEGDNLAIFGMVRPGDHVITSTIEHHAVLNSAKRLAERGCEVTSVPVDGRGVVDPEDVRRALRPATRLITIMMANNETGVLQPVEEIGRIAAEADVYFHTDAVQAAGKVKIDAKKIGCDLLSIAGHKMHAPQGTGAVYVRRGTLRRAALCRRQPRALAPRRHREPAGNRRTGQGRGDRARVTGAWGRRQVRRAARSSGGDHPGKRRFGRDQWRGRSARADYDESSFRFH